MNQQLTSQGWEQIWVSASPKMAVHTDKGHLGGLFQHQAQHLIQNKHRMYQRIEHLFQIDALRHRTGSKYSVFVSELLGPPGTFFGVIGTLTVLSGVQYSEPVQYTDSVLSWVHL